MPTDLLDILTSQSTAQLDALFSRARAVRKEVFGDKIFLYGFVYFSTICRNSCNFCYYRKPNDIKRYRKTPDEVVDLAIRLAGSGVHLIDLTMGEDPEYPILETARKVMKATRLPVMLSPGVIHKDIIDEASKAGIQWLALYQETHNRLLFEELRCNQSYDERMETKLYAAQKNMLIEEGILTGVGESYEDLAHSILKMGEIGASQMRAMTIVPQKGSPMEKITPPDTNRELKVIAALRLTYPDALIPASLDVDGIEGLKRRIDAGANVVTSIIPPGAGLKGVAQSRKDIEAGGRTVEQIIPILESQNLRAATAAEYKSWLDRVVSLRSKPWGAAPNPANF